MLTSSIVSEQAPHRKQGFSVVDTYIQYIRSPPRGSLRPFFLRSGTQHTLFRRLAPLQHQSPARLFPTPHYHHHHHVLFQVYRGHDGRRHGVGLLLSPAHGGLFGATQGSLYIVVVDVDVATRHVRRSQGRLCQ